MKIIITYSIVFVFTLMSLNINAQCFGGQIYTNGNATTIELCTDLPTLSQPIYTSGNAGVSYDFVLTDDNNNIVSFLSGNTIAISDISESATRIWGFSYTGNRIANVGDLVWGLPYSDECYSISSNAIMINEVEVDGGTLSNNEGTDEIFVCLNDNVPDVFGFFNDSNSSGNYIYLITSENNILLTTTQNNYLDFTYNSLGKCKIWGLSYTGNLTINPEMNILENQLSDGCADLSDNFILIDKDYVEGGQVFSSDGLSHLFIEVGDGVPDEISFVTNTWAAPNYVYVITDVTNSILEITENDSKDFEATGPGICRIWGFAYTGDILVGPGDPIFGTQFSSGCFDISSNALQIERTGEVVVGGDVDGGVIGIDGGGSFQVLCPDDVDENEVTMNNNSTASVFYTYIITNENNNIITFTETASITLSAFLPGTLRIWGVSHEGMLDFMQGDDVTTTSLSIAPFELSENFVTIVISIPEAHSLVSNVSPDGIACASEDGIVVEHTDQVIGNVDYIITDENDIIVAIDENSPVDFPMDFVGRIYGVAHFDPLTIEIGDELSGSLSDGCFDLTDNFITINGVEEVDGGMVSLIDGTNTINICGNDGMPDLLTYQNNTTSSATYSYIITDDFGNILAFIVGNSTDFDAAIPNTYRVYGYSFTGIPTAFPGDNIDGVLTDGCYDVSSNYIEVISAATFGGAIFLEDESTSTVLCAGADNNEVTILVNTTSPADYAFVITDGNGIVVDVATENTYVFDPETPAGNYSIFGYSYIGELQPIIGQEIFTAQISDGCFQQAFTFIQVFMDDSVVGGTITTLDGVVLDSICVEDDFEDIISFQTDTDFIGNYLYFIVDENGVVTQILETGNASFDFETLGLATSTVYGLAYTGDLLLNLGDAFDEAIFSNGCNGLSNPITIVGVNDGPTCEPLLPDNNTDSRITDDSDMQLSTKHNWQVNTAPNPIQNELMIRLDKLENLQGAGHLNVMDLTGRIMYQSNFETSESILLETSDWHTGIYILTFETASELISQKLLKQ